MASERNAPAMTGAQRQKRHRDKLRGGPPLGRWYGHTSQAAIARMVHLSPTLWKMARWILHMAPELEGPFRDNTAGTIKITPLYHRLRRQHDMALARLVIREPDPGPGYEAVLRYRKADGGSFRAYWRRI